MCTANYFFTIFVFVKSNKQSPSGSGKAVFEEAVYHTNSCSYKNKDVKLTVERQEAKCSAVQQDYNIIEQMNY